MMKLRLLASCAAVLVFASVSNAVAVAQPAASQVVQSDLVADPAVRFGVLPNGMRYQILKNATPPNNASLRLRIDTGSMYEKDNQRGLAHFLEHMVLNETRSFPEGELIKRLEREGLKFGPDTNASTDFRQTVYMLDVPNTKQGTSLDTALHLLREVAGEATLATAAIDRERGIILSEERTRATPPYRIAVDELGYMLKGDRLSERMPIGLTSVISGAPRERFVEFYNAYYRPERATLIAVGDFDVDAMEAKIRAQFSSWKGKGSPGAELPAPVIAPRGTETRLFVDPGAPTRVSIAYVSPPDLRPDTRAVETERLIELLGFQMMSRRLERIAASSANPPFIAAGAARTNQSDRAATVQILAIAAAGKWQPALAAIEQEQRRIAQFGFAQAELDREITEYRAALTAAAAGAATRRTPALAQAMVNAVNDEDVFTAPAHDLALFETAVKGLTAARVTAATRGLFTAGPLLYLTSPAPIDGGEGTLLAAYKSSLATPVAAAAAQMVKAWPYTGFGPAGTVVERREIADLGATAIRFANGVRLTVKPTDFRDNEILVAARIGHGLLEQSKARPSPAWALSSGALILGGLGKINYQEYQETLASKVYATNFGIGEDAFSLQGRTRPEDFATQMQVIAAHITDAAWQPTGWDRLRSLSGTIHDQLASTPGGVFGRDAQALLHGGDPRWATPTREQMAASSVADGRALLDAPFASGPLEVIVVGDITVDEAIRQTAATFGALHNRSAEELPAAALKVAFPAATTVRATHKGRADQGLAYIAWPTDDFYADQKRTRATTLLAQVLQLRLTDEIREKQGTTYSPNAGHGASETIPGYGFLSAQIEAPPEKLDGFLRDAAKIAADLRDRPVTADELDRARKPLIEGLVRRRASNEFWLGQLGDVHTRPEVVASIREGIAQYQAVTPADLQRVARQYLLDARAWKMEIVPEAKK